MPAYVRVCAYVGVCGGGGGEEERDEILDMSCSNQRTGHFSTANLAKSFGMEAEPKYFMRAHRIH